MKVKFHHSQDYDQMLTVMMGIKFDPLKAREYKIDFQTEWENQENKILKTIEKASKLKFKSKIDCYIVQSMAYKAISHPLTISTEEDVQKNIHLLIHELIHIILVQNQTNQLLRKLEKNYENHDAMVHVPVLLVQKRVEEILYGKKSFTNHIDGLEAHLPIITRLYPKYVKQRSNVLEFLLKWVLQENIFLKKKIY